MRLSSHAVTGRWRHDSSTRARRADRRDPARIVAPRCSAHRVGGRLVARHGRGPRVGRRARVHLVLRGRSRWRQCAHGRRVEPDRSTSRRRRDRVRDRSREADDETSRNRRAWRFRVAGSRSGCRPRRRERRTRRRRHRGAPARIRCGVRPGAVLVVGVVCVALRGSNHRQGLLGGALGAEPVPHGRLVRRACHPVRRGDSGAVRAARCGGSGPKRVQGRPRRAGIATSRSVLVLGPGPFGQGDRRTRAVHARRTTARPGDAIAGRRGTLRPALVVRGQLRWTGGVGPGGRVQPRRRGGRRGGCGVR